MAGSYCKVTIVGNLGKDPEIKSFDSGDRICVLRVATSERWKDKQSGEMREATEWHSIVLKGDGLVGVAERYLRKGSSALFEGTLKTRKWTDQGGQERYTTEIVVGPFKGEMTLLGGKGDDAGGGDRAGGYDDTPRQGAGRGQGGGYNGGGQRGGYANSRPPARGLAPAGRGAPRDEGGRIEDNLDDSIPF